MALLNGVEISFESPAVVRVFLKTMDASFAWRSPVAIHAKLKISGLELGPETEEFARLINSMVNQGAITVNFRQSGACDIQPLFQITTIGRLALIGS